MTEDSFKGNINTIKEIYPGIFQIILDFASKDFIKFLLRENYKYIWIHNYQPNDNSVWSNYNLPISSKFRTNLLARQLSFDLLIKTEDFAELESEIPNGVTLLQTNSLPPEFLDLKRIKGKTRYDLLKKECDFLFEIDLPNEVDYCTLVSKNKDYLIELLTDKKIDWTNLP